MFKQPEDARPAFARAALIRALCSGLMVAALLPAIASAQSAASQAGSAGQAEPAPRLTISLESPEAPIEPAAPDAPKPQAPQAPAAQAVPAAPVESPPVESPPVESPPAQVPAAPASTVAAPVTAAQPPAAQAPPPVAADTAGATPRPIPGTVRIVKPPPDEDSTLVLIIAVSVAIVVTGVLAAIVLLVRRRPRAADPEAAASDDGQDTGPQPEPDRVSERTVQTEASVPTQAPVARAQAEDAGVGLDQLDATSISAPRPGTPASGRPHALLIDVEHVTGQRELPIGADVVMMGRSRQNDAPGVQGIVIPRGTVGRRHACIEYRNHAFHLIDQGSVNGTLLNGERITKPTILHHGDSIRLESVDLVFSMPVEGTDLETQAVQAYTAGALANTEYVRPGMEQPDDDEDSQATLVPKPRRTLAEENLASTLVTDGAAVDEARAAIREAREAGGDAIFDVTFGADNLSPSPDALGTAADDDDDIDAQVTAIFSDAAAAAPGAPPPADEAAVRARTDAGTDTEVGAVAPPQGDEDITVAPGFQVPASAAEPVVGALAPEGGAPAGDETQGGETDKLQRTGDAEGSAADAEMAAAGSADPQTSRQDAQGVDTVGADTQGTDAEAADAGAVDAGAVDAQGADEGLASHDLTPPTDRTDEDITVAPGFQVPRRVEDRVSASQQPDSLTPAAPDASASPTGSDGSAPGAEARDDAAAAAPRTDSSAVSRAAGDDLISVAPEFEVIADRMAIPPIEPDEKDDDEDEDEASRTTDTSGALDSLAEEATDGDTRPDIHLGDTGDGQAGAEPPVAAELEGTRGDADEAAAATREAASAPADSAAPDPDDRRDAGTADEVAEGLDQEAITDVREDLDREATTDVPEDLDREATTDVPGDLDREVIAEAAEDVGREAMTDVPGALGVDAVAAVPEDLDQEAITDVPEDQDGEAVTDVPGVPRGAAIADDSAAAPEAAPGHDATVDPSVVDSSAVDSSAVDPVTADPVTDGAEVTAERQPDGPAVRVDTLPEDALAEGPGAMESAVDGTDADDTADSGPSRIRGDDADAARGAAHPADTGAELRELVDGMGTGPEPSDAEFDLVASSGVDFLLDFDEEADTGPNPALSAPGSDPDESRGPSAPIREDAPPDLPLPPPQRRLAPEEPMEVIDDLEAYVSNTVLPGGFERPAAAGDKDFDDADVDDPRRLDVTEMDAVSRTEAAPPAAVRAAPDLAPGAIDTSSVDFDPFAAVDDGAAGAADSTSSQPVAILTDIDGATATPVVRMDTDTLIVGRSAPTKATGKAYLTIRRNTIGRRHATLSYSDGQYCIEDHQSVNGTFVDGERVVARTPLAGGETITFDEFRFSFKIERARPATAPDGGDNGRTQLRRT